MPIVINTRYTVPNHLRKDFTVLNIKIQTERYPLYYFRRVTIEEKTIIY